MKCDRAVKLFATSGVLGRWRAGRHGVRCPACRAEFARIGRIARELSAVKPLSAAERALWSSWSTEPRTHQRARSMLTRLIVLAAAGAILIGVTLVVRRRLQVTDPTANLASTPIVTVPDHLGWPAGATTALDGFGADLQALSLDLAQLRRQAELLDERRDAEILARRFDHPLAMNTP